VLFSSLDSGNDQPCGHQRATSLFKCDDANVCDAALTQIFFLVFFFLLIFSCSCSLFSLFYHWFSGMWSTVPKRKCPSDRETHPGRTSKGFLRSPPVRFALSDRREGMQRRRQISDVQSTDKRARCLR